MMLHIYLWLSMIESATGRQIHVQLPHCNPVPHTDPICIVAALIPQLNEVAIVQHVLM